MIKRGTADFAIARFESTNSLHKILLQLEKESFEKGYSLTTSFIGGYCKLCTVFSDTCKNPKYLRIPFEETGADIVKTLEKFDVHLNFPVQKYDSFYCIGLLLVGK